MSIRALNAVERERLDAVLKKEPAFKEIFSRIHEAGGTVFLVGGLVRDLLLGRELKDIDIEVHDLELEPLKSILAFYGAVQEVGKSFGVLKWHGVDWSIPRYDGPGRKPAVIVDPHLGVVKALERRDVTMNAMAINVARNELVDPFSGEKDLHAHRLRVPNAERFIEDPLRFFRVMQFIGRFEMAPDKELTELCRTMDITHVSRERIDAEYEKLLLLSPAPSRGFRWLHALGRLEELLPELAALVGVEQSAQWHPEGDVFEHTMQVIDAAAAQIALPLQERKIVLYAALAHDLGKKETTQILPNGRLTSRGHEEAGIPIARRLLQRMTGDKELIKTVLKVVRYHMAPGGFVKNKARLSAYKRLAAKLAPDVSIVLLAAFSRADLAGRNAAASVPLTEGDDAMVDTFVARASEAGVLLQPEKPLLVGSDMLDIVAPGPLMGVVLRQAYALQINEGVTDKEKLKKRIIQEYLPKLLSASDIASGDKAEEG